MRSRHRVTRWLAPLLAVPALVACGPDGATSPGAAASPGSSAAGRPNIVVVLTDDLSWNLLPFMPNVRALAKDGTTFSNYTVTDSLCCPSRSSIFTGRFPHDTGIFTNGGSDGGFGVFHARGEEGSTFATGLQRAGYRTAMMGKYLNGYLPKDTQGGTRPYVPPGWTDWDVAGNGYPEYGYNLNENHQVRHYGKAPDDYLTDVLGRKASAFVTASAAAHAPFLLEVATFAPHAPYTPAPRDADAFPGLTAPRGPAFDTLPTDAPPWLAGRAPLTAAETRAIDVAYRRRAQAVRSVDRMLGDLRATLTKAGVAGRTLVVFSSDNGYHLGEYRLNPGKMTAFDTDVAVPLVVAGPGVGAGRTVTSPVENVDLRPTFEDLAGVPTPPEVDGRSLRPLLGRPSLVAWRTASLVEHHGPDHDPTDPDLPARNSGNPPSYEAIRTAAYTYVEYADGSREYEDRRQDPHQLHNTYSRLPAARVAQLHATLAALSSCHGADACWAASAPARRPTG
jgi:N-acetylglucosamine-6-sulfatase